MTNPYMNLLSSFIVYTLQYTCLPEELSVNVFGVD
jgi:hypothetical protein